MPEVEIVLRLTPDEARTVREALTRIRYSESGVDWREHGERARNILDAMEVYCSN